MTNKHNQMSKRFLFLLTAFVLVVCAPATAQKAMHWKVSGNGLQEPSYLFGTYHLLKDQYLLKYPKTLENFQKANAVMVEVHADSAEMMAASMGQIMMTDEKLSNLVDSSDFKLIVAEMQRVLGFAPVEMIEQFKPSALMMTLVTKYVDDASPEIKQYEGTVMDMYFAREAKALQKDVLSLETVQEQLDLVFNQHPYDEQANQLVTFIKKKDEMLELQKALTATYFEADLKKMLKLSEKYIEEYESGDMAYLTDDRNLRWLPAIEEAIGRQSTFIAVGALHLPGEKGLIQLLKAKGYKVTPVE